MPDLMRIEDVRDGLRLREPVFNDLLGLTNLPVARLIQTVLISCERTPKLLECHQQSIINAAVSAAVLGLEVDGVTGQGFLIPFAGRAQFIIGYKGFNVLGHRAGLTIQGGVVREDELNEGRFQYELGSSAFIRHAPILNSRGTIVAAWATATRPDRTPMVAVLGKSDLDELKARSAGAKRSDSPWNDPIIGYPAMCEKSAKRRLARAIPTVTYQYAAALDDAAEMGKAAHLEPGPELVVEGRKSPLPERQGSPAQPIPELAELPDARLRNLRGVPLERAQQIIQAFDVCEDVRSYWHLIDRAREAVAWFKQNAPEVENLLAEVRDAAAQRVGVLRKEGGGGRDTLPTANSGRKTPTPGASAAARRRSPASPWSGTPSRAHSGRPPRRATGAASIAPRKAAAAPWCRCRARRRRRVPPHEGDAARRDGPAAPGAAPGRGGARSGCDGAGTGVPGGCRPPGGEGYLRNRR